MARTDYSEIFCQAVTEIVEGRFSKLEFDISKECSIIEIIDKANGKYKVSDGTISFEAQASGDIYYSVGDQVIVTIPQGDYNKQITILSKIVNEWSGPAGFVRPLDTVLKCTQNLAIGTKSASLQANGETETVNILKLKNKKYFGFKKVGVAAKFKSLLNNLNVINGDYGLLFTLKESSTGRSLLFTFSCKEMLGNPYEFSTFFKQEYAFDIPDGFNQINELIVDFYQNNQFIDGNNEKLDFSYLDTKKSTYKNLFIDDLEIYLGYSADREISELVEITSDNLKYNGTGSETRDIYLQWLHKVNDSKLEEITAETLNTQEDLYEVRWYQYDVSCEESDSDEWGGQKWRLLNSTRPKAAPYDYPFVYTVNMRSTQTIEQIKAICFVNTHPLINDPTYVQTEWHESNILTFNNTNDGSGAGTETVAAIGNDLSLHFHDGSNGNYFAYDQNGRLINSESEGSSKTRRVEVYYKNAPIDKASPIFKRVKYISWEVPNPNPKTSMIIYKTNQGNGFSDPADELFAEGNKWDLMTKDSNGEWKYDEQHIALSEKEILNENDTCLCQTIKSNNDGSYLFKGKVNFLKWIDASSAPDKFKNLTKQIKFLVWTGKGENDNIEWSSPRTKTLTINAGIDNEFSQEFKLNSDHTHVRVGVYVPKFEKDYLEDFSEIEKSNIKFIISLANPSFKLQSYLYKNTNYPTEDYLNTIFEYQIQNVWVRDRCNNTICCTVNIEGINCDPVYETLQFGPRGSNGTDNTLLLEKLDSKNAITVDSDDKTIRFQAQLINKDNRVIEIDSKNLTFELINNDNKYYSFEKENSVVTVTYKGTNLPNDNYTILKASYKYISTGQTYNPTLEYFIPIPLKTSKCSSMSGTQEILYNHLGVPNYAKEAFVAYGIDKSENYNWEINQDSNNPNQVESIASNNPKGIALSAASLYSIKENNTSQIQDKVCAYCKDYWSQPILIMQSNYDFALLNSWDGTLTIDDGNGIILATMLGAGKKNNQNQFSGVLMGDIKGGTGLDSTETMTGVYGFENGIMTYGLKENGSAFFGAKDNGRIEIDGTSGIIKSAGWTKSNKGWKLSKSTGTLLDLNDGMLLMNGGNNSYFKFNEDGTGKLKMSLSGADIQLTDKGKGLSGYIDVTAQGLATEFRRTASYYVVCDSNKAEKELKLEDFNLDSSFQNSVVSPLNVDDIQKKGVTIAVKFTKIEKITETPTYITDNDIKTEGKESAITGTKVTRQGRALYLKITDDSIPQADKNKYKKAIYINGSVTSKTNPYGWNANTIIYFTYNENGYWEVSDSGSYSKITQTADMIRSEVSTIGGNLSSSISQTADEIRSEVAKKANYYCTCSTNDGTNPKVIQNGPTEGIEKNCILSITFNKANTKTTSNLQFSVNNKVYNVANSPEWEAGETLPFIYNGEKFVMTSLSNSKITQTAEDINLQVFGDNGLASQVALNTQEIKNKVSNEQTGQSFNWSLQSDGFYMNANADATNENYVFKCDKDGVTIKGNGIIKSGNYNEDDKTGMLINLKSGLIDAANFTLNSSQVKISGAGIYFKSSDFSEGGSNSETVLFYYREGIPAWGSSTAIWVHTATDKSVASMFGDTSYRVQIECDSAGNPIITSENGYGQPCYKVRNLQTSGNRLIPGGTDNSTYYISRYYDDENSFNIQSGINSVKIGSNQKYINGVLFDLSQGIIKIGSGSKWISITADGIETSG